MPTTKTGVKITVDTSDIDVKFLKSVDQLNAGLTRTQKKLGQYVDELGRVRTFQDGYAERLSKTQLALGMYADEQGTCTTQRGNLLDKQTRL